MTEPSLRYWLFSYPEYYPSGGLGDLVGRYASLDDAKMAGDEDDLWNVQHVVCVSLDASVEEVSRRSRDVESWISGEWVDQ